MTGNDRQPSPGAMPAEFMAESGSLGDNASGLILRLQDSNRALEHLLRELERDEDANMAPHCGPDAYPFV